MHKFAMMFKTFDLFRLQRYKVWRLQNNSTFIMGCGVLMPLCKIWLFLASGVGQLVQLWVLQGKKHQLEFGHL